jgi:hypothetical protein
MQSPHLLSASGGAGAYRRLRLVVRAFGPLLQTAALDDPRQRQASAGWRLLWSRAGRSGSAAGAPATSPWSESQSGAGRHHRSAAWRTARDDLLGVDPLQVDRRGAEIHMPQLALDDVQRHALTGELERVRVTHLVRREPAPDPRAGSDPAGTPYGRPRPTTAARGSDRRSRRTAARRATRRVHRSTGVAAPSPTHPSRPRAGDLPCRCGPARIRVRWSRSCSVSASASWTRSPARHDTTIIARNLKPSRSSAAWRMTATISSIVGGSTA